LHVDSPAATLSALERERRLALFVAGRGFRVVTDGEFICPECGDLKGQHSQRCGRCHYRAPHPKKIAATELKSGPCPVCGGRKNPKARLCRVCWALDQRLLFAENPAITCPDCGGPKVRKAERCRRCRNRMLYGTVYEGGRPVSSICSDCGGTKKLGRARRCRACAVRCRTGSGRRTLDEQASHA
jgi:hypothetical protein